MTEMQNGSRVTWGACVAMILIGANAVLGAPTQPSSATRPSIVLQAADAEMHGTVLATTRPAYTASGYATAFDEDADFIRWHAPSPAAGLYQVEIRYSAAGPKGYGLEVNGVSHEDQFAATGDAWATHSAGKVELRAGNNTIEIHKGWGFYDIDRVEFIPTTLPELKKPSAKLVDKQATPATVALMQHLVENYGHKTLSGVTNPDDAQLVQKLANVWPAIMAGDLIDYSPSRIPFGAKSDSPPERLITDSKAGYLISMLWHWNAPDHLINTNVGNENHSWYFGFYTHATTFDVEDAMKHPEGPEYKLILRDIDAIAVQLKKFDDAGVPILWRPLHEADGKWFWWGAKGPDAFKALWALMFDRLTNVHHLHNLIWVYTGSANWDWYPPADQFDVIGVDAYPKDPHDPSSALWDGMQARWGDQKLIALTEFGGVPDLAGMAKLGVRWSYFASWGGPLGPGKVPADQLPKLYHTPTIQNRPAFAAHQP